MGINKHTKDPGETNENKVHDDQHATSPYQIQFSPISKNYRSTLFKTHWY